MKLSILMSSRIAISCFCLSLSSPSSSCNQGNSVPCMVSQNCDSVPAKKDMVISSVCFLIVSQRHLNSQLFIAMSFLFKKLLHQGVLQEAQSCKLISCEDQLRYE